MPALRIVAQTPAPMTQVSENVFQIGDVKLDKQQRTVTFPATVNMRKGMIEYLLVTNSGKTHESLFATSVEPSQLHVAMLLLGATAKDNAPPSPDQIDASYLKRAPALKGDNVDLLVTWKRDDKEERVRAEELVMNDEARAVAKQGPWIYTGSIVSEGKFLAQLEGSIVSMVTDPVALINNPRPGHNNDQAWSINTAQVPPMDTPVEITIKLLSKKPAK